MTVVHRLTGYDKKTEQLAMEHDIPETKLKYAKDVAGVEYEDMDAIGSYPLNISQTKAIAKLVGLIINVDRYYWFLEPFDQDGIENTAA